MSDDGVLDPWVARWLQENPQGFALRDGLPFARQPMTIPVTREVGPVADEVAAGVPVRIYQPLEAPTGLLVYAHGGAHCVGSVALMDNVARELTHATGAVVVSVDYRLAPENPFPAGLDDTEAVTRWALANSTRFGVPPSRVAVSGESAGGSLAAGVTLRLRDDPAARLAGQVLIYPAVDDGTTPLPSRTEFAGLTMPEGEMDWIWEAYTGGRDLRGDPFAAPLHADSLAGLPPALVVLGGCDFLRDEGRLYAEKLRADGVEVDDVLHPGQIHGFLNYGHPAAAAAYDGIGTWVRALFARVEAPAA
ncbi:alpha/beta hydrolase [Trujillonella endophytica]|uniref:Acetyl esterase n=1 Tax=Trujillonella endophytica TaxID=673521 RepID=A0A1H8WD68_9ACTN|nr:alpha/beta hydrolase [Trujillella endophytica]SEP25453.1 acetyl esterase [Trujillella endophytica]